MPPRGDRRPVHHEDRAVYGTDRPLCRRSQEGILQNLPPVGPDHQQIRFLFCNSLHNSGERIGQDDVDLAGDAID